MGLAESMPMWECGGRRRTRTGSKGAQRLSRELHSHKQLYWGLGQYYLDLQRVCEGKDT